MKAYVLTTGIVFGLLALAHLWRIAAEGLHLLTSPLWVGIIEGQASVGVAGLVRSQALGGTDFELLCALRSEAQGRGLAKEACKLAMAWAFDTAKLDRVIACVGDGNDGARAIATKLGMTAVGGGPRGTTVYVKDRVKHKRGRPAA